MGTLLADLRLAARQLAKARAFTLTVTLTLALCLGANAMIFGVVQSVVLRPLPVPEPDRIVTMWNAYPGAGADGRGSNGAPDYFDRRALTDTFEELAAYDDTGYALDIDGVPQRVSGLEVTPSFFTVFGGQAAAGRTFLDAEQEPGAALVVILSDGLRLDLFGDQADAIGRTVEIDGRSYEVVGVMPPGFDFPAPETRLWTPLRFTAEQRLAYHSNQWTMVARLRPVVTVEQAQARIDALNAANLDRMPELKPLLLDAGFHTPVVRLQEELTRDVRANLYMLWAGVSLVLLIGCVNVANLVLVRATARARELATRIALGASAGRLLRVVLTEVWLVTGAGAVLGLTAGLAGLRSLGRLGLEALPRSAEIGFDATTVAFTAGLALAVSGVVSLLPLASVLRVRPAAVLREQDRGRTSGRGLRALRKGLVVAQVAVALVLLAGTGLLAASFRAALTVDPGFTPDRVLTAAVVLPESRYPDAASLRRLADEALARIRALPGVERAAITSHVPFGPGFNDSVIFAEGYVMRPGESVISPTQFAVSPGYFEAMDMQVAEGRGFDARDTATSGPVIVIDERLARRFWPDRSAVGQRMWMPQSAEQVLNPEDAPRFDIVGVVEPILIRDLTAGADQIGAYYFPLSQASRARFNLVVRTAADPTALVPTLRRTVADLDAQLPISDVRTLEDRVNASLSDRRLPLLLASGFSLVALVLATVGLYGALAYLVQLRTREIGVRVALGSSRAGVVALVLGEGGTIVGLGLAAGLAGTVLLTRAIAAQLYAVDPVEPSVLAAVAGLLAAVGLGACLLPAWKALRIDPVRVLGEQ